MTRRAARSAALSSRKVAAAGVRELTLLPDRILHNLEYVVDVGANSGDWTSAVLTTHPVKQLIAVEPDPSLQTRLRERFADHDEVVVVPAALGRDVGELELHLTGCSASSSLLPPRDRMNEYYGGGFSNQETVRVPVTTLDRITVEMPSVSLLKLDVQGYEAEVLLGGIETLRKTSVVMMEVTFYSHYEGDASFDSLHKMMAKNNFALWNLSAPFKVKGVAMWSDAIYCRSNDTVLTETMV